MDKVEYSPKEELANRITHGLGIVFGLFAAIFLLKKAQLQPDFLYVFSFSVFIATMLVMYTSSTVYHSVKTKNLRKKCRIIDHIAIYFLIAGTYTPFMLVGLESQWGIPILIFIWCFAIFGLIYKTTALQKYKKLSLLIYLTMGWIIVFAIYPMIQSINATSLWLLLLGGITYTIGTYFYKKDSKAYNHAIWHIFVLGGTVFHTLSIYNL